MYCTRSGVRALDRERCLRVRTSSGPSPVESFGRIGSKGDSIYTLLFHPGAVSLHLSMAPPGSPAKSLRSPAQTRPGTRGRSPTLANCQVQTPIEVVKLVWSLIRRHRANAGQVLDLGSGDGRFALFGRYRNYTGYEIDPLVERHPQLPENASIVRGCVLDVTDRYDVALGNPPFIRNQDLDSAWRFRATELVSKETGIRVHGLANLYIYFMWLATLRTKPDGVVGLVVPYEWISRPTGRHLRDYLRRNGWHIQVYHIVDNSRVFAGVKTTACITIIDKRENSVDGSIELFEIGRGIRSGSLSGPAPRERAPFPYVAGRGVVYPNRGFSPGSQGLFCMTEKERLNFGVKRSELLACVTTLRHLPRETGFMDSETFESSYVEGGRKCWLLVTAREELPEGVRRWLTKGPRTVKTNSTCSKRKVWYRYESPPVPRVLYAAGFSGKRPKMLLNLRQVRNVGSVHGIFGPSPLPKEVELLEYLRRRDFTAGIVPHSDGLMKIEVSQMNGIVRAFYDREGRSRGRQT